MAKKTYKVSGWNTSSGANPIGVPYRNTWLYATLKGDNLTDCTIDKVTVKFPKLRCTFDPAGELRMKYGGVTLTRAVGSTGGAVQERSYNMQGAKNTMFKDGSGEVIFYAYHPYDEGYLAIDDGNVTVEVEYTPKASRLVVLQKTVEAGQRLQYTIESGSNKFFHNVTLEMGEHKVTAELEQGVTEGDFLIPLDWLEMIPDKSTMEGTLTLETLDSNEELVGTMTVSGITMTVPVYTASMTYEVERMLTVDGVTYPDVGGRFVQGKCGIRVKVTGAEGYYGSTVTSTIRIGDKVVSGVPPLELESGLLMDSRLAVQVTGVDSRGVSALARPVTIMITPYVPPQATLEVWRVNDDGKRNDFGTKGMYSCSYTHTEIADANPATVTLTVSGVTEENPPESGMLLPSEHVRFDQNKAYDVTLTVTDKYETATRTVRLPSAAFLLHGNAQGNGAGIGHAATEEHALVINPDWKVYIGGMEAVAKLRNMTGGGGGGTTGDTTALEEAIQTLNTQVTALQTQLDSYKPRELWGGTWNRGNINVPGIADWSVVQVDMGVGSVLAFVSDETVQGGGFNVSGDLHRTLAFRATRSGDACTLVTAHYINHEAGSAHGDRQSQTVQRIVGLVHK